MLIQVEITCFKIPDFQDRSNETVYLMADVKSIMHELGTSEKWRNSIVAVASCCDEPKWAVECINKFPIGDDLTLEDVFKHKEIYKSRKLLSTFGGQNKELVESCSKENNLASDIHFIKIIMKNKILVHF